VNSQSRIIIRMRDLLKVIGPVAFFTLTAGAVSAQSQMKATWKATGEIISASKTTINGFSAVSGATVFNNNRIRTDKEGAAIINLGRLGRIELGPNTDLTIRISEASIGGELRSSQMVVSAQKGVAIAVNAAEGVVTTDGREPAVVTIYLDGKSPRAIAHKGTANVVTTGGKGAEQGKGLSQSPGGDMLRRGAKAASVAGAATLGQTAIHAVPRGASPTPFSRLFKAGIDYSISPKSGGNSDTRDKDFDSSITCHNNSQTVCHRKSSHTPE
jgi:hypothetical protein